MYQDTRGWWHGKSDKLARLRPCCVSLVGVVALGCDRWAYGHVSHSGLGAALGRSRSMALWLYLIEKDHAGVRYRFIHKLLQDHFAQMEFRRD